MPIYSSFTDGVATHRIDDPAMEVRIYPAYMVTAGDADLPQCPGWYVHFVGHHGYVGRGGSLDERPAVPLREKVPYATHTLFAWFLPRRLHIDELGRVETRIILDASTFMDLSNCQTGTGRRAGDYDPLTFDAQLMDRIADQVGQVMRTFIGRVPGSAAGLPTQTSAAMQLVLRAGPRGLSPQQIRDLLIADGWRLGEVNPDEVIRRNLDEYVCKRPGSPIEKVVLAGGRVVFRPLSLGSRAGTGARLVS